MSKRDFLSRLQAKEYVICAEGYLFELEQRGYLKAGAFVPEVVLEHPDVVRMLHEEFVHAGSDVVEAFTYYGHRTKMSLIGRENDLENLNTTALRIARKVADDTGTLMAGNICNTTEYADTLEARETVQAIFKEQVEFAVAGGADLIIGETYGSVGEAMLALEAIKTYGNGLPAVITMADQTPQHGESTAVSIANACKQLEDAGAAVVGLNCRWGPATALPVMREIRRACKGPIACMPVPYRTNEKTPMMQQLLDPKRGVSSFPGNMNPWLCSRFDIEDFTKEAMEIGVQYMGLCCGNQAHYIRTMAETLGRHPPASKYSPDMSQHFSQRKEDKYQHSIGRYQDQLKK